MVSTSIFYPNLPSFMGFTLAREDIHEVYRAGAPIWYLIAIEAQRLAPSSYSAVVYHAPVPRVLVAPSGERHLVKFQLKRRGLERDL